MKKAIYLLCILAIGNAGAQSVTTYAGAQYLGSGGYHGSVTKAMTDEIFSTPAGICLDTNNRFYVTDQHNISLLSSGNSYTRGGYTGDPNDPGAIGLDNSAGTVSRFFTPQGVFVSPKSNEVYICDRDNGVIRKGNAFVTTSNQHLWSTFAGTYSFSGGYVDGLASGAKFGSPEDLVITKNGTVYVSDFDNDCIRKIAGGMVSTFAGRGKFQGDKDGKDTSARFYAPMGMCLMDDDNILLADRNNRKIKKITISTGQVTTVVTGLNMPVDVAYVDGAIYITDGYCVKVWDGQNLKVYAGDPSNSGYVNASGSTARFGDLGLMVYRKSDESLYICDRDNNVIRRLTVIQPAASDFIANKTAVTTNEVVTLTSKSLFATSFLWTITPGNYALQSGSKLTDSVIYVTFSSTGSYGVTLKASNATGSDTKSKPNYINVSFNSTNPPTADFFADNTTPDVNETVKFIDQSGNSPQSWLWTISPMTGVSFVNGTDSYSRFPEVKFASAGSYSVTLKSSNSNGSNSKLKSNYIVVATNSYKTKGYDHQLTIYPNPASDVLYIRALRNESRAMARFTNISGQTQVLEVLNGQVQLQKLSPGFYSVGVEQDGRYYVSKLVLAR